MLGKSDEGNLFIYAQQKNSRLLLYIVSDDGRGLDCDAIKKIVVEKD